jgi:DNA-binding transcriptional MocR family regulator
VSAQRVFDAALDEGVAFVPGAAFFADSQGSDGNLRLSLSLETPDRLDEGVQRLARALRRVMA